MEPTNEPPSPSTTLITICETIYVDVTNFDAVSAVYINAQSSYQELMANITHEAIANSSIDYGIARDEFTVNFQNATGDLLMKFSLCTSSGQIVLTALNTVLEDERNSIEEAIKKGLVEEFSADSDSMTVSISQELQFRFFVQIE